MFLKSLFFLATLLLSTASWAISPQFLAALDASHLQQPKKPLYSDSLIENILHEKLLEVSQYKKVLPTYEIKATQNLQKAWEHFDKGHCTRSTRQLSNIKKTRLLNNYITFLSASCLEQDKKYEEVLKLIPRQSKPLKQIEWDLFWIRQKALAKLGRIESLEQEIKTHERKQRKNLDFQINKLFILGTTYTSLKRDKDAKREFEELLVKYAGNPLESQIFEIYKDQKWSIPESMMNLRAERLIKNGHPHQALDIWKSFFKKNSRYAERVAYGTYRARDYQTAAKLYEELLKSKNSSMSELEILQKLGTAYARHDQFEKAIQIFEKIIKKYGNTRTAKLAKWKLAFLYFDSEQYEKAPSFLEPFATSGTRYQRNSAKRFLFWSYYLTKNYDKALEIIESKLKIKHRHRKRNYEKQKNLYWKARILENQKNKKEAREIFKDITKISENSYYGLLAKQKLKHKKIDNKTLIDPSLLTIKPVKFNNEKIKFHGSLKNDELGTALLLSSIGQESYAFNESQFSKHNHAGIDFDQTTTFIKASNAYRPFLMRKKAMRGEVSGAKSYGWKVLSYPLAFAEYLNPYTDHWELDPALPFAIMRQESAFQPGALSYANAYGLMQIIPPTGDEIATKIGYENFKTDDLNKPKINLLFGTFYLKYLLDTFDNDLIYAIAGYNAGPDAVSRWKEKAPRLERDEFVELIPYNQTRDYVKKVLTNYLHYKAIWGL